MTRVTGVLGAFAVVLVIVLVNGGYVYKTTCPQSDGHTETSWSYQIDQFIPYIGFGESGCTSHTGTREILSAVGLWKLNSGPPSADNASQHAAALELRTDKARTDHLDGQVLAVKPTPPLTRSSLRAWGVALAPYVAKYAHLAGAVQSDLSRLSPTVSPDVHEALSLLARRDALTANGFSSVSTDLASGNYARAATDLRRVDPKIRAMDAQFNALIDRINGSGGA